MKKKILGGIAVMAIAAIATFNININIDASDALSSISLSNVEALAQTESGGGYAYVNCDGHNIQCTGTGDYKCCR